MRTATALEKLFVFIVDETIFVITILFSPQHLSFGTVFDNKSLSDSLIVNAAFQQTLWSVAPICSGGGVAQGKFDNWLLYPRNVIGQRDISAICDAYALFFCKLTDFANADAN